MANNNGYIKRTDFDQVFAAEVKDWVGVGRRRESPAGGDPSTPTPQNGLVGLALSGGGIRSATFALGACQAMAKEGVLKEVDYLSTVSGGSYLGAAIASHIAPRNSGDEPWAQPLDFEHFPFSFIPQREGHAAWASEPALVRHLREFSNYLAPRLGLFAVQTWYSVLRTIAFAVLNFALFVLPLLVIALYAPTLLSAGIWNRGDPLATPLVIATPVAVGAVFIAIFALSTTLCGYPQPSFFRPLHKVLMAAVFGPVLFELLVLGVWAANTLEVWFTAAFGTGLVAIIPAARWAYQHLKNAMDAAETLAKTSPGAGLAKLLPALFFGVLGYFVLGGLAVVVFLWLDAFDPDLRAVLLLGSLVLTAGLGIWGGEWPLNAFSLHGFYRTRLAECYVNPTDPRLVDLVGKEQDAEWRGPYPIVGTALNLGGDSDKRMLTRKSDAFFMAPLYCGSSATGFVQTAAGYPDLTLSTAMAISGAAFSPNQGAATSTSLAIILALVNARLGYWLRSPAIYRDRRQPRRGATLLLYLQELFGNASGRDDYVYLTDGGHFEASGIYELVRRRCRYIIALDASGEPSPVSHEFVPLGDAARLCRIDFGVDIRIRLDGFIPDAKGRLPAHFALGRILYPRERADQPDEDRLGLLIYIKASLATEERSPDVESYAKRNPEFPDQPTFDQFFDEQQFESYRALGYHIAQIVFRGGLDPVQVPSANDADAVEEWGQLMELRRRWNIELMRLPSNPE